MDRKRSKPQELGAPYGLSTAARQQLEKLFDELESNGAGYDMSCSTEETEYMKKASRDIRDCILAVIDVTLIMRG